MPGSVLIVDDEENLRHTLAFILKRAGYYITAAESAKEALSCLSSGSYDIIVLDLRMPEMDGLSLMHLIHEKYPNAPIFILTAYGSLDSAIEALRLGARDYFLKPVDPAHLIKRIEEVLEEERSAKRKDSILNQMQNLLNELGEVQSDPQDPEKDRVGTVLSDPSRYLRNGPFFIDMKSRYVEVEGRSIAVPPSTFAYLVTLLRHSPDPVNYQELVAESQGYTLPDKEARSLARWQIYQIRHAIEASPETPQFILTVRNMGYRMITNSVHKTDK